MHDVLGQLAVAEHYQPNMQDTVTLLCRFMDIPTKVGTLQHHSCSSLSASILLQYFVSHRHLHSTFSTAAPLP